KRELGRPRARRQDRHHRAVRTGTCRGATAWLSLSFPTRGNVSVACCADPFFLLERQAEARLTQPEPSLYRPLCRHCGLCPGTNPRAVMVVAPRSFHALNLGPMARPRPRLFVERGHAQEAPIFAAAADELDRHRQTVAVQAARQCYRWMPCQVE